MTHLTVIFFFRLLGAYVSPIDILKNIILNTYLPTIFIIYDIKIIILKLILITKYLLYEYLVLKMPLVL